MPETKAALIVANWQYEDADLRHLLAPANDAEALAGVLRDPKTCGFEVTTLLNRPSREACEQIERFFLDRKRDDLLLLYFSCHGIKDDDGLLYFAAPDTRLIEHSRPLRSTALSADFVRSVMRASNSRRQVLMLDCCYSGAFASAMLGKGDKSAGVRDQFEQGRGMVVMTASDALQYSFEGDSVAGEPVNSIFTRVLVKGIETGEADHDRDGTISLDELYDYVYDRVVRENPNQRPKKWDLGVEGRIIVAQTPVVRVAELAPELIAAIGSPLSRVRLGAVAELADLIDGGHKGLAAAARQALENLAGDDSRQVSIAAEAALGRGSAEAARPPVAPKTHAPVVVPPVTQGTPAREPKVKRDSAPGSRKPRAAAPASVPQPAIASMPVQGKQPEAATVPEDLPKRRALFGVPYGNLAAFALTFGFALSIFLYRYLNHSRQTGQSSIGQTQAESTETKSTGAVNPLLLPAPPFTYTLDGPKGEDTKVRLQQVSTNRNQITDEEEWLKGNDLELPELVVPNPFMQKPGDIPPQIPVKQGDSILIKAIKNGNDLLCVYGRNFGTGRYLTSYEFKTGKVNFAFDFHDYMRPPKYLDADREYVDETVHWAQVQGNILYVSTWHNTYAKSSFGLNGYLNALDIGSGRLLWRSQALVTNSANFLLYKDAILTGYGFTDEQHFLYVLNQKDGRVVQTIPVRKSPSYILNKGNDIYVRTYDADLVFRAMNEGVSKPNVKD